MKFLTEDAALNCAHMGVVRIEPSQGLVTVGHRKVLVESDPEGCDIDRCPNRGSTIKPCMKTLPVREGYSTFIRVAGHKVCLETVWGLTDGTPPGGVKYMVRDPGQQFVAGAA